MKQHSILLIAFALFTLSSCRKSDRDLDNTTHTSTDHFTGEAAFNDAFFQVHAAAVQSKGIVSQASGSISSLYGCDTVITDTTTSPMTMTIDFGSEECEAGSIMRQGKIRAEFNGKYDKEGAVITITFQSYKYQGIQLTGEIRLTHNGENTSGKPTYAFLIFEGELTKDKKVMNWEVQRNLYWVDGVSTYSSPDDDRYIANGATSGTTFKGNAYESDIAEEITLDNSCKWPYAGRLEIKPEHLALREVTLSPSCDKEINITINSKDYTGKLSLEVN